jgi:hypothetical protein
MTPLEPSRDRLRCFGPLKLAVWQNVMIWQDNSLRKKSITICFSFIFLFFVCWHHSCTNERGERGRRCGMISAVSILCVIAIVLTLVLILKLIFSFHDEDGVVEIDIRDKGKGGPL